MDNDFNNEQTQPKRRGPKPGTGGGGPRPGAGRKKASLEEQTDNRAIRTPLTLIEEAKEKKVVLTHIMVTGARNILRKVPYPPGHPKARKK